ncbi:MAG: twin-arginine translocase subunit TatB [Alphaproteobacteria bacterium]|nr:MAG: twin-arginine translocase subunit TatB [Alphaproteobacteria bacterium]
MLDIGWSELMVIGVVALLVVGPKDLPGMFRTIGQYVGKARSMAREFQRSMEAAAREAGMEDVAKAASSVRDVGRTVSSATPMGLAKMSVEQATSPTKKPATDTPKPAAESPATSAPAPAAETAPPPAGPVSAAPVTPAGSGTAQDKA